MRADDADVYAHLLGARHSCRAFLSDPLPKETIERLLRLAQRAASWCNTQPWHLHLTSGAGTERLRAQLQAAARASGPDNNAGSDIPFPDAYSGIHLQRRRETGFQLYDAVGVTRGDRAAGQQQALKNFDFFGAPHHVVVTTPVELGTYGAMDCAAWVATFLVAAQSLGVAAIAQAAVARYSAVLRQELSIPQDRMVVCGVSFGREDTAHPANAYRTARAELQEAVTWVDD